MIIFLVYDKKGDTIDFAGTSPSTPYIIRQLVQTSERSDTQNKPMYAIYPEDYTLITAKYVTYEPDVPLDTSPERFLRVEDKIEFSTFISKEKNNEK